MTIMLPWRSIFKVLAVECKERKKKSNKKNSGVIIWEAVYLLTLKMVYIYDEAWYMEYDATY